MPEQSSFEVRQKLDPGGVLRLTVLGGLDVVTARRLHARLRQLKHESERVRLDLSQLEFIDSAGINLLALALRDARADGWHLEIHRQLSPEVRRTVELAGVAGFFWPGRDD